MAKQAPPGKVVTTSFTATTPKSFSLANGDPAAITQLRAIEDRSARVKARARAHFGKYEETWVVKESVAIWKKRAGLAEVTPALPTLAKEYTAQSVMTEARRNVRARMTQRLTSINSIRTRMSNSVIRNLRARSPSQNQGPSNAVNQKRGSPSQ